jgi:hypothetical protein
LAEAPLNVSERAVLDLVGRHPCLPTAVPGEGFESQGPGIEDVAVSATTYGRAVAKGLSQPLPF